MKFRFTTPLVALALALSLNFASAQSGPTNAILFVSQVRIAGDFISIASTFGNQSPSIGSCGRGGDLYIRYPDGTVTNLTRAAGFGKYGAQHTNGIAVREPSMHWSGKKAVFSMVIGAPRQQFDIGVVSYWQLYEITNFTTPGAIPIITKVPNQPTNYNNVAPIYGTDDRIIFASDRPRNGQRNLYPQLDEYEEQPTVTGLWSLAPATGDLFLLNHTPSGAFSPEIDSAGRVVFVRWDHLQRDQQADSDVEEHNTNNGAFNWSDESLSSLMTTNQAEVFPEPRSGRDDLLAGMNVNGHNFNQFFPWQIHEDGEEEETVNHVGRHELGGSYRDRSFINDDNLEDIYNFAVLYNTNVMNNFLDIREDPNVPGLFYGIDAPEFGTHGAGQLVTLVGGTNINPDFMRIAYLTPRSTSEPGPASDHTGLYRNPLRTTDGYLIVSHTAYTGAEPGGSPVTLPTTPYDFRIKTLRLTNGFYVPDQLLTAGLTNRALYYSPDVLVTNDNVLWELDPVEVVARQRPARLTSTVAAPELAAFASANVDLDSFQNYLRVHQLALIISRDVTTRDKADILQPLNLRIPSSGHQTTITNENVGKIYDIASLQLFQGDQIRSLNHGNPGNPGNGRRVIAQYLHDPAVDNATDTNTPIGSVTLGPDGSMAALVPARRALSWQLIDTNATAVVRERYWLTFQPGEIRTCASCHGVNTKDQAGHTPPTNTPAALISLLNHWKTNTTIQPALAANAGASYPQITFTRRPAELGVTYHVQTSADLATWADLATYAGTNIVLTANAQEISRTGSPNEQVTVRTTAPLSASQFLRVKVTTP